MKPGSIFTFYSYKGGTGRTLALANIAALLLRWGYKVLCVDWDLEAPGLHLYFQRWIRDEHNRGLTELIQGHVDGKKLPWRRFVTSVKLPRIKRPLSLITAGLQDQSYVQRMQALDWPRLYENQGLGAFIEQLREAWKKQYDFVLVDSRTGITDIGGICTVQLPDYLVLLFTANEQSLGGALSIVEHARETRSGLPFDRAKLLVLPVATRLELRVEYREAQKWLTTFEKRLAPLFAEWLNKTVSPGELLNHTRVPSIPYWSFGERLPVIEKGTSDPEDIGYPIETLAALVAHKLAFSDALIKNRDSYVEAAKKRPPTSTKKASRVKKRTPPKLFISYSHKDARFAERLMPFLDALKHQRVIAKWIDSPISAGTDWQSEIDLRLEQADVVLLLISVSYLASEFAYSVEMKRALERQAAGEAIVIPVILSPANLVGTPIFNLQTLPRGGKAISLWPNRDKAFVEVVHDIEDIIEQQSLVGRRHSLVSKKGSGSLRRLEDSLLSQETKEMLLQDAERRAHELVPDGSLRRRICQAARYLLRMNKGQSLSKEQLMQLDKRFLLRREKRARPDSTKVRWVLRAAGLHPQGRAEIRRRTSES